MINIQNNSDMVEKWKSEYDVEKTLSALDNIIKTYSDIFPAPGNDVLFLLENYQRCIDFAKAEFGNDADINMLSGHHYDWSGLDGENLKTVTKQIVAKAKTLKSLIEKNSGINTQNELFKPSRTMLENLLNKFNQVAIQLENRKRNKTPLKIDDEYDVQYLLHGLLKIYFKDVRAEDAAPTSAGANSFIDFVLPEIETGIECKKTRKDLKDKEIGEELVADITRYKKHPDCKLLYCFIHDTAHFIENPDGLKSDLEKSKELPVKVIIIR